jgi:cobalt/nickel transport system permease protein
VLLVLLAISTSSAPPGLLVAGYGPVLAVGVLGSGLPVLGLAKRVLAVASFTLTFSAVAWLGGDSARALLLATKALLSSVAILLFVGTTPLHRVLVGLARLGAPALLIEVMQFVYRYLFVLASRAATMRHAAACRGGFRFDSAASAAAALFGSAYCRAEGIHRAMLARGAVRQATLEADRLDWIDRACLASTASFLVGARLAWSL